MPDLMPDTSIYQQNKPPDIGTLMGMIGQSRRLQTQQAISDALKGSVNPDTGLPDATAAGSALARSNAILGSDDFAHLQAMQKQQAETRAFNTDQIGKAAAAFYNKQIAGQATPEDWHNYQTQLAGYGIPPNQLAKITGMVISPDGKVTKNGAADVYSFATGGAPLPSVKMQTPGGTMGDYPAAAAQLFEHGGGPRGFVPTSIPGAAESGAAAPVTSSAQYAVAQKNAGNYTDEIQPLLKIHSLATELGEQGLGKGTGVVNDLKNFLIANGAEKMFTDFDKDKAYKYQELTKYLARYADQMSAGGTDARLIQAVGGNPNVGMNQQPVTAVTRYIIAMRRMKQVQFNEYSSNPANIDPATGNVNAGKFGQWSSRFLQNQDPRAYAFDLMGEDNANALYKELNSKKTTAEKDRFKASLDLATKHGMGTGGL